MKKYIDTPDRRKAFPSSEIAPDYCLDTKFADCNGVIGRNCGKSRHLIWQISFSMA